MPARSGSTLYPPSGFRTRGRSSHAAHIYVFSGSSLLFLCAVASMVTAEPSPRPVFASPSPDVTLRIWTWCNLVSCKDHCEIPQLSPFSRRGEMGAGGTGEEFLLQHQPDSVLTPRALQTHMERDTHSRGTCGAPLTLPLHTFPLNR